MLYDGSEDGVETAVADSFRAWRWAQYKMIYIYVSTNFKWYFQENISAELCAECKMAGRGLKKEQDKDKQEEG